METNINGIIIDGKVYEHALTNGIDDDCASCDLRELCMPYNLIHSVCSLIDGFAPHHNWRYSQTLTEKLKKQ